MNNASAPIVRRRRRLHVVVRDAWCDEGGVTAIEYGLLAALIVLACTAAFTQFSTAMTNIFDYWSAAVIGAISG